MRIYLDGLVEELDGFIVFALATESRAFADAG
jgi:hypothetical protein